MRKSLHETFVCCHQPSHKAAQQTVLFGGYTWLGAQLCGDLGTLGSSSSARASWVTRPLHWGAGRLLRGAPLPGGCCWQGFGKKAVLGTEGHGTRGREGVPSSKRKGGASTVASVLSPPSPGPGASGVLVLDTEMECGPWGNTQIGRVRTGPAGAHCSSPGHISLRPLSHPHEQASAPVPSFPGRGLAQGQAG